MSDLEPVWSGALWRQFDDRRLVSQIPATAKVVVQTASVRQQQVLAAIPCDWTAIRGIAKDCGLSVDSTQRYLAELYAQGLIERKRQIRERRGRLLLYRRVIR